MLGIKPFFLTTFLIVLANCQRRQPLANFLQSTEPTTTNATGVIPQAIQIIRATIKESLPEAKRIVTRIIGLVELNLEQGKNITDDIKNSIRNGHLPERAQELRQLLLPYYKNAMEKYGPALGTFIKTNFPLIAKGGISSPLVDVLKIIVGPEFTSASIKTTGIKL